MISLQHLPQVQWLLRLLVVAKFVRLNKLQIIVMGAGLSREYFPSQIFWHKLGQNIYVFYQFSLIPHYFGKK